ncbi:methyltransferase, partial [Janthinobacterium sp. hw3]|nr:methyltransferase [Janthinobacterium fluminis]
RAPLPASASAPCLAPAGAPPAGADGLLEQARSLADLGQFQLAGEKCHAHLAQAPDAAEAYFILGILNEQAGKTALAEDYWRRCIYLQPDHYEALCHLALLTEHNGNGAAAAALKARAARIFQRRHPS